MSILLLWYKTSLTCPSFLALRFVYNRWDEWVHPSRLLKLNETNLALQKSLQQANAAAAASSAGASNAANKTGATGSRHIAKDGGRTGRKDGARGTKRGREEVCLSSFLTYCTLAYASF